MLGKRGEGKYEGSEGEGEGGERGGREREWRKLGRKKGVCARRGGRT